MSKIITLDKTKKETREAVCNRCDNTTNHAVCGSVEFSWGNDDIQGTDTYEIIRCSGCDSISYLTTSRNSEDFYVDDEGDYIHPDTTEIYPSRLMGRTSLEDTHLLPINIRTIYTETHAALCAKLKILAGVGIRALIEAVCVQEAAKGHSLENKIEDLVKNGVLTQKSASILHKTRVLGNMAAHEAKAGSDSELDIAFDIAENLLETVYIIPKKAELLK